MTDLTFRDVLSILRFVDSGPFGALELEIEGTRLRLIRTPAPASVPDAAAAAVAPLAPPVRDAGVAPALRGAPAGDAAITTDPGAALPPSIAAGASADPAARHPPAQPVEAGNGTEVKPPMAGTFYAAPSPGAPPFVEVGRAVGKGDQLGIVEVMKLFTSVLSPCDGVVRAILVANEEPVRSDQTLMVIEAA